MQLHVLDLSGVVLVGLLEHFALFRDGMQVCGTSGQERAQVNRRDVTWKDWGGIQAGEVVDE